MASEAGALLARLGAPPDLAIRAFAPLPGLDGLQERPILVDQTHRSVVVSERLVVKWFTPPLPPPHRSFELLAHLAAVGFGDTAAPYAAAFDARGRAVALITAYLPEARDGWDWCVEAAVAGEPVGALLGGLAAGLHAALATPSALLPEPVSPADPSGWHARAADALDEALALTDDPWLHGRAGTLRDGLDVLRDPARVPAIDVHGDLHVGQILKWRGGYAVIDFDGNPTLAGAHSRQPAARDVAQLLTSLEHVAQIAFERRDTDVSAWLEAELAAFLDAYRARLAALGRSELFAEELVRPFAIEQECRELIYAARFLPRWRYAPLGVLRSWYRGEP
ncbi:hypothetical protein ABGB12_33505 [Actinocorallia sp. B10E7]|uniref:hypothetical protein n=1 Tax=Actinocorallia sp. B10E7 TaxID=3153558 RepID=UPI00325C4F50